MQDRIAEAAGDLVDTIGELYRLPLLHILRDCVNELLLSNPVAFEEVCLKTGESLQRIAPLVEETCLSLKHEGKTADNMTCFADGDHQLGLVGELSTHRADSQVFAYLHALVISILYRSAILALLKHSPEVLPSIREHIRVYRPTLTQLIAYCWRELDERSSNWAKDPRTVWEAEALLDSREAWAEARMQAGLKGDSHMDFNWLVDELVVNESLTARQVEQTAAEPEARLGLLHAFAQTEG